MLTPDGYRPRLIDATIGRYLGSFGAVNVRGPKYCGKTWSSLNASNSVTFLQNHADGFATRRICESDPSYALKGEYPHLIDEWQDVPEIWDAVRFDVDLDGRKGKYILCGSSVPSIDRTRHSGAGRIGDVDMRTMSLYESGDSDGTVSLSGLFEGGGVDASPERTDLDTLIGLVVRGGWPSLIGSDIRDAMDHNRDYLSKMIDEDVRRVNGGSVDSRKLRMFIRSLARNEGTVVSDRRIIQDMETYDKESITPVTLSRYTECLERLFLVRDQPAFDTNLRSTVRVSKSRKRHLADPSLAVTALNNTPATLRDDLDTFEPFFESLCERDLDIYASSSGGRLFHYRDDNGNEIDAVVEMPDGSWGAFEIKLGLNQVDRAAEHLLRMSRRFERPPKVLAVICGLPGARYTRRDGVHVIPITCLRD